MAMLIDRAYHTRLRSEIMGGYDEIVTSIAKSLELLAPNGDLGYLDSMQVIDLVVALEEATGISVPSSQLFPENFASVGSVSALLHKLESTTRRAPA